ncbi:MAG TPA: hypothetical protein VIR16_08560 [Candidatus Limnocylindrales bacterium]
MDTLDRLLAKVRAADKLNRMDLRDLVVAQGPAAVAPMADWIGHPEYSRFAVRALERLAQRDDSHEAAVEALLCGREDAESRDVIHDIDEAFVRLGVKRPPAKRPSKAGDATPQGQPGQPGRRYWAMRTSQHNPDFIWAEVKAGRLRQGWGWMEEQDLRRIAERRRAKAELSSAELQAWRAHRMLATESAGMRVGDLVVTQNLPRPGRISVCRVAGLYYFELPGAPHPEDLGHILPVKLLVGDIDRWDGQVSDALRHAISLRPRLYEITQYGGDVETLLGLDEADTEAEPQAEAQVEV